MCDHFTVHCANNMPTCDHANLRPPIAVRWDFNSAVHSLPLPLYACRCDSECGNRQCEFGEECVSDGCSGDGECQTDCPFPSRRCPLAPPPGGTASDGLLVCSGSGSCNTAVGAWRWGPRRACVAVLA